MTDDQQCIGPPIPMIREDLCRRRSTGWSIDVRSRSQETITVVDGAVAERAIARAELETARRADAGN